jgi:predicted Zn-dependent protease
VWIDERSSTPGFDASFTSDIRRAFADWGRAGAPLTFTFVADSASADVTVTFRERFDEAISGRTRWVRDPNWWIVGGDIVLALRTPSDRVVTAPQLYAIALHEIGHLLGLDHTRDTSAVMAPRVSALQLTPSDIATMRLIYTIPPGSVRTLPPEAQQP